MNALRLEKLTVSVVPILSGCILLTLAIGGAWVNANDDDIEENKKAIASLIVIVEKEHRATTDAIAAHAQQPHRGVEEITNNLRHDMNFQISQQRERLSVVENEFKHIKKVGDSNSNKLDELLRHSRQGK